MKVFKIRPLWDLIAKFQQIPQQQILSIDKQMAPLEDRSLLKQYVPKKPNKRAYKIFMLSDMHSIVHNIYWENFEYILEK